MAAYSSVQYAKQLLALTNGASQADGNATAETLCMAKIRYTCANPVTEANGEILTLWLAPAGATIIPALSSVTSTDAGTTITGTVGTVADPDAYSTALTISATGTNRVAFAAAATTYPTEFTEATAVIWTWGTVTDLVAGTVIEFDIAYTVRH